MGLKADSWIKKMSLEHGMISPFCEKQVGKNVISYGLSSYGYDIRVGSEFMLFDNKNALIDPKNFDPNNATKIDASKEGFFILPANAFALAHTIEYFKMPKDTLAICLGKSTYARCGIIVNVTPFEPEFEGYITIEISNTTNLPAKVYANEGIAQVVFLQGDEMCEQSYKDRDGKYQGQVGITLPKILK
ncbi:dCTP deaminase [Helicobacter pylori]|uniref:dCTP deaminase n=1 Tax=Helicobacter pylori TaxID=210 RepID=UPI00111B48FF|nr:dCTP deaminase [Helicobacter pylori]MCQ2666446.1 dCTP deaminase [Helicobacter pylori]MCQ2931105.1 dCTP deaminase [Helicobacter pylori]WJJ03018.1 dCTP deaminase [Helicobacter pylori]WRG86483.1 dCTP deaminase [Helicobacter pylori]